MARRRRRQDRPSLEAWHTTDDPVVFYREVRRRARLGEPEPMLRYLRDDEAEWQPAVEPGAVLRVVVYRADAHGDYHRVSAHDMPDRVPVLEGDQVMFFPEGGEPSLHPVFTAGTLVPLDGP
jgi:hypothetical protein